MRIPVRAGRAITLFAAIVLLATGCSADPGVQRRAGGATRYIEGSGVLERVAVPDRAAPVAFEGPLLDGGTWRLADHRGKVVVLNVWGSWCPPCRKEAPDLQAASEQLAGEALFVGVNIKDTKGGARAYLAEFGITYPTVYDESGEALLAFRRTLPPAAIPSTLVFDRQGRVAARVLGAVNRSTIVGLVQDVAAEPT